VGPAPIIGGVQFSVSSLDAGERGIGDQVAIVNSHEGSETKCLRLRVVHLLDAHRTCRDENDGRQEDNRRNGLLSYGSFHTAHNVLALSMRIIPENAVLIQPDEPESVALLKWAVTTGV